MLFLLQLNQAQAFRRKGGVARVLTTGSRTYQACYAPWLPLTPASSRFVHGTPQSPLLDRCLQLRLPGPAQRRHRRPVLPRAERPAHNGRDHAEQLRRDHMCPPRHRVLHGDVLGPLSVPFSASDSGSGEQAASGIGSGRDDRVLYLGQVRYPEYLGASFPTLGPRDGAYAKVGTFDTILRVLPLYSRGTLATSISPLFRTSER